MILPINTPQELLWFSSSSRTLINQTGISYAPPLSTNKKETSLLEPYVDVHAPTDQKSSLDSKEYNGPEAERHI
jgi:hypothetical protein